MGDVVKDATRKLHRDISKDLLTVLGLFRKKGQYPHGAKRMAVRKITKQEDRRKRE